MHPLLGFIARTSLAAIFIGSGLRIARDPNPPQVKQGEKQLPVSIPRLDLVVRAQAAAQVAGGVALAAGIRPDLSASLLALTLIPVTYVGHPFWTLDDPQQRRQQLTHFLKNLGIFGGLVYVAADARHRQQQPG